MKTICADNHVTMGIDVSHYQGTVYWSGVKAYGVKFAFMKASEHKAVDPAFRSNWAEAKRVGLFRGAYHFFHPSEDPTEQAKFFCDTVGDLDSADLPCVMDWESTDGTPSSSDIKNALTFLRYVEDRSGKTPIVYAGPYFLQVLGCGPNFTKYPLWVAQYGPKCPLIPLPWTNWKFWQKTANGNIGGVNGLVDVDVFNGSLEDLHNFIARSKVVLPSKSGDLIS